MPSAIVVGASASDQAEAIGRVGRILVDEGVVTVGYIAAMREREAIISTYLGNGIALPHGTSEVQDTILRTGLAVAQFPDGVSWGGEQATLVIGLAARSEEHIAVISRLASVLADAELCRRLSTTSDPLEIHRVLTEGSESPAQQTSPVETHAISRTVRIANPSGLHARPAAEIVEKAMDIEADVIITAGERHANACSITQVIALGAARGDVVTVSATGDEAAEAVDAVLSVLLDAGDGP
jgi:multiphosphoryl transfer protein